MRNERAAIRYATFPPEHPVRQRLGGAWSHGASGVYPPPLRLCALRDLKALTHLQCVARLYPADGERIDTRALAPWEDPINTWGGRLSVMQKPHNVDKRRAAVSTLR